MIEVIFDIETQKLFDQIPDRSKIVDLGVSVVSAYRRELDKDLKEVKGEMKSFWIPGDREELLGKFGVVGFDELWGWFEGADRIIGFNSLGFDVPVLAPHYWGNLGKLAHFDILAEIKKVLGHRLSLDALARETLGETKTAVGTDAVVWWDEGSDKSLNKLQKYCEMDVVVTKKVYDVGLQEGKLKFKDKWNDLREVEVDFSYPEKEEEAQLGLF